MRISEILKEAALPYEYEIIGEKVFDTLALCSAKIQGKICTFLDDSKYIDTVSENVVMLITTPEIREKADVSKYGLVLTDHPRPLFFELHNYLSAYEAYARKAWKTTIAESARVSELAYVSPHNVCIEENVIIEPFVTIYPNVHIGRNSIIRSGARIGGEGFEYKRLPEGILPVIHLGGVEIGSNVEIQNNTCIDKAVYPWDNTVIGNHVKIDNLVYVGHAVKIAENTMVVANTGIGGRTEIGENAWIGLGATIRNGLEVGNNARVNMGAVVTKSVEDFHAVSGNFAIEHEQFISHMKRLGKSGMVDERN